MKSMIRGALRAAGYDITRYEAPSSTEEQSVYEKRLHLIQMMNDARINLVLDVGANAGQYGEGLRRLGFGGWIVSFEPLSEAFEMLERRAKDDPKWLCHRMALGDTDEEREISIAGNLESSSLLPMCQRHVDAYPKSATTGSERILVRTLDGVRLPEEAGNLRIMLKLDTQGYEKNVLLGGAQLLESALLIDTELTLVPLYEGQPLITEMLEFLRSAGFDPVSIENAFTDPKTGHALQVDGIFIRQPRPK